MKRCLFFVIVLLYPVAARSQGDASIIQPQAKSINLVSLGANLAFGPSSTITWDPSLAYRRALNDHWWIGIGDLSYGSTDLPSGTRHAIMGGPMAEYTLTPANGLSYSILAGITIQDRWGAEISASLGIAPYGAFQAGYEITPSFTAVGSARLQFIASDAYLRTPRMLPSASIIVALGLGVNYLF
jgi:hypothetical protein